VYTHGEIKAIAQWAMEKKVWVIADEIYRRIHYGPGPAPSFLDLPDELLERVIVIYGVSKAYAMTGWRIGLALAPSKVAKTMHSSRTRRPAPTIRRRSPSLRSPTSAWSRMLRMVAEFPQTPRYRERASVVTFPAWSRRSVGRLLLFRVDSFGGVSGMEFCTRLITTTGVAMVPGAAFETTATCGCPMLQRQTTLNGTRQDRGVCEETRD
jgi:aspartate/methionine/tyrosine aminotransferase